MRNLSLDTYKRLKAVEAAMQSVCPIRRVASRTDQACTVQGRSPYVLEAVCGLHGGSELQLAQAD